MAATCLTSTARADGNADSERANLLFKKGKLAFNAGKYTDALRIYGEAWSLKQSPDIAANLAQTEAELGKHRDAAEHFAFAFAHLLPSSTDDQKNALAAGLEIEKKEISTLHVTLEPADSQLAIDDTPLALPANGDIFVEPGDHRAVVSHQGYEANAQTLHTSKGASEVLWIKLSLSQVGAVAPSVAQPSLPSVSEVAPPKLDESAPHSAVPAVIAGGLVVAGAAVGTVFLLSANASQKDSDRVSATLGGDNTACGGGTTHSSECAKLHDDNNDITRSRALEVTGFAVAGAAAVGTLIYLLWPRSADAAAARSLTPSFAAGPGMGNLSLTGRF